MGSHTYELNENTNYADTNWTDLTILLGANYTGKSWSYQVPMLLQLEQK